MNTTAALVHEHGPRSITMSQIAEETGIGRATLYRYVPSVETILLAWHVRRIPDHLDQLAQARDQPDAPIGRLQGVLEAYALVALESRDHHGQRVGGVPASG